MSTYTPRTSQPFELDYNEMLRQAYYDCVTSLNALESSQIGGGGMTEFENKLSWGRFTGSVLILEKMILEDSKDDQFKKDLEKAGTDNGHGDDDGETPYEALDVFHAITELFNRKKVFKSAKGWVAHI